MVTVRPLVIPSNASLLIEVIDGGIATAVKAVLAKAFDGIDVTCAVAVKVKL